MSVGWPILFNRSAGWPVHIQQRPNAIVRCSDNLTRSERATR